MTLRDEDATIYATDLEASQDTPAPSESFDATVYATEAPPSPERTAETTDPESARTHDGVDRTHHALQGMEIGALFRHRFQTAHFGISPRWRIRLNTPDGMSTEGGTQARQALVLHREGSPNVGTFTFGHLDATTHHSRLKTYDVMRAAYLERYGRKFEMVESEYERLLDEVRKFLTTQGYLLEMTSDGPTPNRHERDGARLQLKSVALIIGAILAIGIAIGYALGR